MAMKFGTKLSDLQKLKVDAEYERMRAGWFVKKICQHFELPCQKTNIEPTRLKSSTDLQNLKI